MQFHQCDRNKLLAKVHIAKKDLNLSDEVYRNTIFGKFGVRSARKLENTELVQLLVHFEDMGWRAQGKGM